MRWLAIDIGGANLKAADGKGFATSVAFPLWKEPKALSQELRTLIASAGEVDHLAITMTGELADCFSSKEKGVAFILEAVKEAAAGKHVRVYLKDGRLVAPAIAQEKWPLAGASNWHALARFACRFAKEGAALLVDVGSTTCDVIPLLHGSPVNQATDDTDRMIAGELVYTGIARSSVAAVAAVVPYRESECPIAHEFFANMRDVYVILGKLREDSANKRTADGRASTKANARARLGRCLCAEGDSFNHKDAVAMAQSIADAQRSLLSCAIGKVMGGQKRPIERVILSGKGEFLAKRAIEFLGSDVEVLSLSKELSPEVSRAAPAHALAVLADEGG